MELLGNLPLTNNPEESFNIVILDVVYSMRQLWNTLGFWTLDISDEDGNYIVSGVKLVSKFYLLKAFPSTPFDLYFNNAAEPDRDNIADIKCLIYSKD